MESLFTALRKYSPRENNDPLENFVTEAFAWLLKNELDFSAFFLEKIDPELGKKEEKINLKGIKWSTQTSWGGVYPDMICELGDSVYIFEHKVWTHLHGNQLQNYINFAQNKYSSSKMILITAGPYQWTQKSDLAICWSDVYCYIKSWLSKAGRESHQYDFVFSDFLELLKNEGLAPTAPITREAILGYYHARYLHEESVSLFQAIIKYNNGMILDCLSEHEDYKPDVSDQYGRVGIDLFLEWRPGLFVGFLLDYEDYEIKPVDESKGPDCCFIFNFDDSLHNNYPHDELFERLTKELEDLFINDEGGWQFYNHFKGDNPKNMWHPLYVRKPMLEVLAGLGDEDTLTDKTTLALFEELQRVIEKILGNTCFNEIRNFYKNQITLDAVQYTNRIFKKYETKSSPFNHVFIHRNNTSVFNNWVYQGMQLSVDVTSDNQTITVYLWDRYDTGKIQTLSSSMKIISNFDKTNPNQFTKVFTGPDRLEELYECLDALFEEAALIEKQKLIIDNEGGKV